MKVCNNFLKKSLILKSLEFSGGRSKPLTTKYIQQLFSRTWNVPCRIDLMDQSMIIPGDHGSIRLTLLRKMVMSVGQPFTVRENECTIGTGIVTAIHSPVDLPKNKLSKLIIES